MADADEDAIPTSSTSNPDDFDDETQDFRFLSSITAAKSGQTIVPKRGDKDFEPNPTRSQASALDASRLAMHQALSSVRVHVGKHIVGQYLPSEEDWRWDDAGAGSAKNGRCVVVPKFKGTHSKTMGLADRYNSTWFLPEEALFLLERGTLDIRWPDNEEGNDASGQGEEADEKAEAAVLEVNSKAEPQTQQEPDLKIGELPMSLQGAYASFVGKDGLTLERYTVYAGLRRIGYIVQRAPTWHDEDPSPASGQVQTESQSSTTPSSSSPTTPTAISNAVSLIHRLVSWLSQPSRDGACTASGPLVAPGLYRNYTDMFRALSLIPYHDPIRPPPSRGSDDDKASQPNRTPKAPFRIHFHVWKPNAQTSYRKSAPPPPDYRIAVVDARTTSMPTLSEISDLLDSQPDDALTREKAGRLETRIRHGRKNVLLAVVDMGVVSYLRLSDACFGAERLYEEKARAGSKGKRPNHSGAPRKGNQVRNQQQQQQQQPENK
ncbi:tRNA-splicing endonuclease subunit sen54 [Rhinocladiella similis]